MSERTRKSNPDTAPSQRFDRPDAETAAQGGPAHERERAGGAHDAEGADRDDRAHGYTQDSGYRGSGGYGRPADERGISAVEVRSGGNGHAATDRQISSDVRRSLQGQPAPRVGRLLISVGNGVVTLSGDVDDHIERDRLLGLVRAVPSVREVRDQLQVRDAAAPPN